MSKISKSPERMTFQAASYERALEENPDNKNAKAMVELWQKWREDAEAEELNDSWQQYNMEFDLRTSDVMLEKVRLSDTYAQNLYAAMCNMQFMKWKATTPGETMEFLREQKWSCSWRHSGGIIADMRQEGDYIDWYCSGIGDGLGNGDSSGEKNYVPEGCVTEEIKADLYELGWIPVPYEDEK